MLSLFATALAALLPATLPSQPAPPAPRTSAITSPDKTLEERLASIVERLEEERVANHIPGMALAIVKDDEVILTHGFGLADIETGRKVDGDTLFAIGSSTKAFTTALGGMLQDDGVLDFDDPVTKYLPDFKLPIDTDDADAVVTLRDLMSHRTGFARMTPLWAGGRASRELILKTAIHAEPTAGFRKKFIYNNVMFLAAGMAEAAAANKSWDELIESRIFAPLGMSSSQLSAAAAQKDERLALGYEWEPESGEFKHKPMRELVAIAPAGAIDSNVRDMSQWLRFLLGRGEFEGQRLISEDALNETWTANTPMGSESAYGLGWMLHDDNGTQVVEHGGNIDGFSAEVALLPEQHVGFVLLMNVTATPLQTQSIEIVFEGLMGDAPEESTVPAAAEVTDFDDYLGNFEAEFGSFDHATFRVLVQNEHLAVDVPGQMVYELKSPDESGKWFFRMTDAIAVDFVRDEAGNVVGMHMFQGGMAFDLPREGYEAAPLIPLAELEPFLGTFHDPALDEDIVVLIHRNRLAIDIPSQMVYDLRTPDDEGKRAFWITDVLAARFNVDEAGVVTGLTLFERGTEREVPRVGEAPVALAPSTAKLDQLFEKLLGAHPKRGLGALLAKNGSLRSSGTVRVLQSGLEGTFKMEARLSPPAARIEMDFGAFGSTSVGISEEATWIYDEATGYREMTGARRVQLLHSMPGALLGDWRQTFDSAKPVRFEELDGKQALVIELQNAAYPKWTMFVDPTNGNLLRTDNVTAEGPIKVNVTSTLSDYKDVDGEQVAHTSIESNAYTGSIVSTVTKVELGVELAPDFEVFAQPK